MFKNYLKIAFRNLFKYKGYSTINVLGLAVGIAVCILIFGFVSHELSYDNQHAKSDRIYRVTYQTPQRHIAVTPSVVSSASQTNFPEVQEGVRVLAYGNFSPVVLQFGDKVFRESSIAFADSSFFNVFTFKVLAGNPNTALTRPNTMVISDDMARKYFGNENPIGKTLLMNNEHEYEITAVIKKMPSNSHFRFDFIASLITFQGWAQLSDQEMKGSQFYTYLVLQEGADRIEVEKKIDAFINENFPDDQEFKLLLQPLTHIHLYSNLYAEIQPQGDVRYVMAASAIALLILVIACINYMNLATARAARRSREIGIRKVLGSDRKQLIGQFYGESALLVGLALMLAVLLVEIFLPLFNHMTAQSLIIDYANPTFWILMSLIGVAVTFLVGSYPAFMLSAFKPVSVLKGDVITEKKTTLRKTLVVFQFAVSVFLIISTLAIYQQVGFIQDKELGYKKENVIALTSYSEVENRFDSFKSDLMQISGVDNVTMASDTPVNIESGFSIDVEGVKEDPNLTINGLAIHPEFNRTLHIDIVAGRDLRQADYRAANPGEGKNEAEFAFLLNEAAARTFGLDPNDIVGRRASMSSRKGTIVGVVENFHFAPLHSEIEPLVMFPEAWFNKLIIGLSSGDVQHTLDQTQRVWEAHFTGYPFEYVFLDQEYNALYQQETRAGNIFTSFAILAIFVACLGLVGLASFMVEQRAKEIGMRKVLGATATQVMALFSKDFVVLILVGFVIAVPIAWYVMAEWLQNFAYRIQIHWSIFLMAGCLTMLIALLTVSYQAVKVARMNPVDSLRSE